MPLFPLVGFILNAFLGAGLTKSPRPVVETGEAAETHGTSDTERVKVYEAAPTTEAPAQNAGPSDAATFVPNAGVTAAGDDGSGHGAHGAHGAHSGDHPALSAGGKTLVGGLATVCVLLSFVVSLLLFFSVQAADPASNPGHQIFSPRWEWMSVPSVGAQPGLSLGFGLMVDPLTSLMLLIITGVGTLIHLYSMGYMADDKGYARYFTYLNLFVFFMLLLVMGSNLLVTFVGWEGVGLASYLLVGFYYERVSATNAGKKAFIVNRVGDCALLIALFLIFRYFGTFEYYGASGILTKAGIDAATANGYQLSVVSAASTLVPLLMLLGAAGKSAQIPLYLWLPDAMEGPTPVSALIHAATMVTGGVYLVCRTHSLFLLSPVAMTTVAVVGLTTAFLAATIALVQTDIKRVLAYSTVSQLGYMFLACGVGAFSTAMFHVMTHAFFKALLFLGAGSVIHAMGGEQDMRKMGALGPKIQTTFRTMLIGTLAIAGIPPLAGFWSKDEILLNAFAGSNAGGLGSPFLWAGGFVVSGLTAFYMVRMMMKTFAGQARYTNETAAHIHESPPSMTIPLLVLAFFSLVGGLFNMGIVGFTPFEHFLEPSLGWREEAGVAFKMDTGTEVVLLVLSAGLAIGVALWARSRYLAHPTGELSTPAQKQNSIVWRKLNDKWGVDDFYQTALVKPGYELARGLWRNMDTRIIDGMVRGISGGIGRGGGLRGVQSGYVRNYAFSMFVGVFLVVAGCLIGLVGR